MAQGTLTYILDLDGDLLNHLADSKSFETIQQEQIDPRLLEDSFAKKVFNWQRDHYREHGRPASGEVLQDEFEQHSFEEPVSAIGDLIDRLRERFVRNEGRDAIRRIADMTMADPLEMAKTMLEEGRQLAHLTTRRGESFGSGDFKRVLAAYERQVLRGKGPSLGFDELDEHFFGCRGVTFLEAGVKLYKSWYVINMMMRNIYQGRNPCLYTLELPAEESNMRLACMAANIPFWKYIHNKLTHEDKENLCLATDVLDQGGHYQIEKPEVGERGIHRLIERALNAGHDFIIVDQLQYVEARNGESLGALNNTGYYFEVVNELRNYSDEIPIFVVHQLNRPGALMERPEAQYGKGSASIEEVATLALGLWSNKEMRKSNILQVTTMISRNSDFKAWDLEVELSRGCKLSMIGEAEEEE